MVKQQIKQRDLIKRYWELIKTKVDEDGDHLEPEIYDFESEESLKKSIADLETYEDAEEEEEE